jgi:hypothetical protein
VVQGGGALVEATRVPGIGKPESLKVQVMAELMAKGAQERSERRDLLANRRSHPDADEHRIRMVVAEKFRGRVFPDAKGPGGKHADAAPRYLVKV